MCRDRKTLGGINSLDMRDAVEIFQVSLYCLGDFSEVFYFFLVTLHVIQTD